MSEFSMSSSALLGISVNKLNLEETIEEIQKFIALYHKDLRPRSAIVLTADTLAQAHRQPEILHALREASLVVAVGSFLSLISRLLGARLPYMTGIDIVAALAKAMNEKKQSLYLLGGDERTLRLSKIYLEDEYPNLSVKGVSSVKIDIQGEPLLQANQLDLLLLEQINQAAPDILLINLGSPKQEIWFTRVKDKLHVPVSLEVGDTLKTLAGLKPQAPLWMQKSGLAGIFHFIQDPKGTSKKFLNRITKLPFLSIPLLSYNSVCKGVYRLLYRPRKGELQVRTPLLFISPTKTLAVLPLPVTLNKRIVQELLTSMEDLLGQDALILDFRQVHWIDTYGMDLLMKIWRRAAQEKKRVLVLGINPDMRTLLQLHKCWDILQPDVCNTPLEVLDRIGPEDTLKRFFDSVQQDSEGVIISFFGALDHHLDAETYLKKIRPLLQHKNCILDFNYCTYIDNAGIAFLLMLKNDPENHLISFHLSHLNPALKRQIRFAQVDSEFKIL